MAQAQASKSVVPGQFWRDSTGHVVEVKKVCESGLVRYVSHIGEETEVHGKPVTAFLAAFPHSIN